MPDGIYSLADLCDLADVTPRTVRYYISQGLLRSPGTTGPGARYDDGHLARLRLIRRLQREHLPLAEIRKRLAALSDGEAILQAEGPTEPPTESALDYVRGVLDAGALGVAPQRPAPPASSQATSALRKALVIPSDEVRVAERPATYRMGRLSEAAAPAAAAPDRDRVAPDTAPAAERSSWDRITLAPDVELHVRRPLTRSQNRAVARLVETARRLLEEDQP